jgi:hypothetical protein
MLGYSKSERKLDFLKDSGIAGLVMGQMLCKQDEDCQDHYHALQPKQDIDQDNQSSHKKTQANFAQKQTAVNNLILAELHRSN